MTVRPYYDQDGITIWNCDCRDVLPTIPPGSVDLVLTDPPYGIGHKTNYATRGRGILANTHDFPLVHGDDMPFDPTFLITQYHQLIMWGANYYANKLPLSNSWLIWDKRVQEGKGVNDQSDGELAWSNTTKGVRIFRHMWNGFWRDSERGESYHPTQKPVALMRWCLQFVPNAQTILDPFMGSGTTLRAAKDLGRKAIGIEIEERYCEIAAKRLSQTVMRLEPKEKEQADGPMMAGMEE